LREIYTAPTVDAAEARFGEFAEQWRDRYPAMISTWEQSWGEFVPFLDYPVELRAVVYTTNAAESLNARFRKAVRHRGHFPNEQAALKVLYLVATERRKNRATPPGGSTPGNPSSTRSPSTTATASRPPTDHDHHARLHNRSDSPLLSDHEGRVWFVGAGDGAGEMGS
jgi:hypothetical protein